VGDDPERMMDHLDHHASLLSEDLFFRTHRIVAITIRAGYVSLLFSRAILTGQTPVWPL
jgi:hypothetical protein